MPHCWRGVAFDFSVLSFLSLAKPRLLRVGDLSLKSDIKDQRQKASLSPFIASGGW